MKKIFSLILCLVLLVSSVIILANAEGNAETLVYVSATGDDANNGKAPDTAFKTIKHATEYLASSNAEQREIKVIGTVKYDAVAHDYPLIISGNDSNAALDIVNTAVIKGDTKISDINLYGTSANVKSFSVGGNTVEFNNVTVMTNAANDLYVGPDLFDEVNTDTADDVHRVIFNGIRGQGGKGIAVRFGKKGTTAEAKTINGTVDVVVNSGYFSDFAIWYDGTVFKGDFNFTKNGGEVASDRTFLRRANVVSYQGALQVVVNDGKGHADIDANVKTVTAAKGKWIMYATPGDIADAKLSVTETAGTFNVSGATSAIAVDSSDSTKVYTSQNGVLTVPAGTYNVTYSNEAQTNNDSIVYVSETGDDANNGKTPDTAFKTIKYATEYLALSTADNKEIKIVGTVKYDAVAHDYPLIISGNDSNAALDIVNAAVIKGDTKITDIKLYGTSANVKSFSVGGNTVEFNNVTVMANSANDLYVGPDLFDEVNTDTADDVHRVIFNGIGGQGGKGMAVRFGKKGTTGTAVKTINGTVDVVVNSGYFSDFAIWYDGTAFKGDFNFTKNGGEVAANYTFLRRADKVTYQGALQVVVNDGKGHNDIEEAVKTVTAAKGKWIMYATPGDIADAKLSVTETAGTFNVTGARNAIAVDATDSTKIYTSQNGVLTVPAGTYNVTYSNDAPTNNDSVVYVSETGDNSNDGKTPETAFGSIDFATKWLAMSTAENKEIKIIGNVEYNAITHDYPLTISGYDNGAILKLRGPIAGPTEFKNLSLWSPKDMNTADDYIYTNGKAVEFTNVLLTGNSQNVFYLGPTPSADGSATDTAEDTHKVVISGLGHAAEVRVGTHRTQTINGDVDIVVNSGVFNNLYFYYTNSVYNGNISFTKNGGSMAGSGAYACFMRLINRPTLNGALQIIVNDGTGHSAISSDVDAATPAKGKWIMYGDASDARLSTTDKAGKFNVIGSKIAKAVNVNDSTEVYFSENGVLEVPQGTYNVSYSELNLGDANNDSKIDICDLVSINEYINNESTDINILNADLDGDGKVTELDLTALKKELLG